jgi:hypothetical protein
MIDTLRTSLSSSLEIMAGRGDQEKPTRADQGWQIEKKETHNQANNTH